ncbi:CDP-glycerol glycerophosphotransferase family protein [Pseudomonas sp. LFM046]|uniref:CDP-glycerol glycerophosphotransferase family protein n=1 Tax=Pseudomonas sp. LFM046 TaxID=1608357 RepID=UPI0006962AB5|nr:CDP-glycerol glycerophosphotransferase family protein [Pseudomonas sp. LFM046]
MTGEALLWLPVPDGICLDGEDLCLTLDGVGQVEACRLLLVGRRAKVSTVFAAQRGETGFAVRIPLACFSDDETRWDVRVELVLADGSRSECHLLGQRPDDDTPRHFFNQAIGERGLSAYLSDSASSLVFYGAPREFHARATAGENAKQAFARYLAELPLDENLVIFESFLGKSYSGNPRYIYEELRRVRPDLRCVWSYNGSRPIPGDPEVVRRGSPEYFRLLAQAKYRVNNVIFPVHGRKEETLYLQAWHGTPLKKLSFDIEVSGPEMDARDNFYRESRAWTLLLSENAYSSEVFRRAFRYEGEVLELGYPLTDPLLDANLDRPALARSLGLPEDKRFILYAPTWRDHKAIGAWQHAFDLQLDLDRLSASLADDQVLLIKAHHLVAETLDHNALPSNVRDLSHLDDVNELCMLADVLITDYSSVFFDFAVTGRPILFYCYDLELYASAIRGFYLDVHEDLPGPVAQSNDELLALLGDLDRVAREYKPRYQAFQQRFASLNDGRVARRVVQAVFGDARNV